MFFFTLFSMCVKRKIIGERNKNRDWRHSHPSSLLKGQTQSVTVVVTISAPGIPDNISSSLVMDAASSHLWMIYESKVKHYQKASFQIRKTEIYFGKHTQKKTHKWVIVWWKITEIYAGNVVYILQLIKRLELIFIVPFYIYLHFFFFLSPSGNISEFSASWGKLNYFEGPESIMILHLLDSCIFLLTSTIYHGSCKRYSGKHLDSIHSLPCLC